MAELTHCMRLADGLRQDNKELVRHDTPFCGTEFPTTNEISAYQAKLARYQVRSIKLGKISDSYAPSPEMAHEQPEPA